MSEDRPKGEKELETLAATGKGKHALAPKAGRPPRYVTTRAAMLNGIYRVRRERIQRQRKNG